MKPKKASVGQKREPGFDAWGDPLLPGLKVYEMTVDDLGDGVDAIALVDAPAIGVGFQRFSKARRNFSVDLKSKRLIGPILIPGALIYRDEPEKHYQRMTRDVIEQAVHNFALKLNHRKINVMHNDRALVVGVVSQLWVKQNDYPLYDGDDCPVGTAYACVVVDDHRALKMIDDGFLQGFSMQGWFGNKLAGRVKSKSKTNTTMAKTPPAKGTHKPTLLGRLASYLNLGAKQTNYLTVMLPSGDPLDLAEDGTLEVTDEAGMEYTLMLVPKEAAAQITEVVAAVEAEEEVELEADMPDETDQPVDLTAETALRKQMADLEKRFAALQQHLGKPQPTQKETAPLVLTTRKPTNPNGIPTAGAAKGKQALYQDEATAKRIQAMNEKRKDLGLSPISMPPPAR